MKAGILSMLAVFLVAGAGGGPCDQIIIDPPGPPTGQVFVSSSFDMDNDGWRVTGLSVTSDIPDWSATEGNPAGSISARFGSATGDQTGYFLAPAKFLGGQNAAYGGAIEFDRSCESTQVPSDSWQCLLVGGDGVQLGFEPADGLVSGWQHFVVPLDPSGGWKRTDTEQAATEGEIRGVLENLVGLRIRGGYRYHYYQHAHLDNVQLVAPAGQ